MHSAAPEGGFGWWVVAAYVVNMSFVVQLVQMMGLVLKDVFRDLGFSESQGAVIISTTHAASMLPGVLAGPLIRRYGFRVVAVAGALLAVLGMALTSTATTFAGYMLYFGIIMALGLSLSFPAYTVALNVYFQRRRTLATAVAMSLRGGLAILTPQLIRGAAELFGNRGAILALAGVALQSLAGAALLRPLPSPRLAKEAVREDAKGAEAETPMLQAAEAARPKDAESAKKGGAMATAAAFFVSLFDLSMLRDPALVLLMVGSAAGLFTDVYLVQFLPFLLKDCTMAEASVFMSVFNLTDTACRLVAPLVHRLVARPSRDMYLATLVVFMATRTSLLLCRSHAAVMAAMVLIGASRGINVVFLQLLVPDNVPVHRMAAAQGLYLLLCGVLFTSAAPVVGLLLSRTGDYDVILLVLLAMNALVLVAWTAEDVARALRARRGGSAAATAATP